MVLSTRLRLVGERAEHALSERYHSPSFRARVCNERGTHATLEYNWKSQCALTMHKLFVQYCNGTYCADHVIKLHVP